MYISDNWNLNFKCSQKRFLICCNVESNIKYKNECFILASFHKKTCLPDLTLSNFKQKISELENSFRFSPKLLDKCTGIANFNICSWNVAGLRALLKKFTIDRILNFLESEKIAVLCLQETKCDEDQVEELNIALSKLNYKLFSSVSSKPGYAGVFCYANQPVLSHSKTLENFNNCTFQHHDSGRCLTIEFEKFYLLNLYVPNSGMKLKNLGYRINNFDEDLHRYSKELSTKKPVILAGDMNVSILEYDLANPDTNRRCAGFSIEERQSFADFLKTSGFYDVFRAFYPDKRDAYTYWSYMSAARARNIGWRLDYFLCSKDLADKCCDVEIKNNIEGSDHCPIILKLSL
ncbi:MAG: DNA-(apurinic or apyrimidinic site) lyase [Marteilia pararefringens]